MAKVQTLASVGKPKGKENNKWIKVTNKKAERKAKALLRPGGIIICRKDNLSHAEILNKVKSDPDLKDLI